MSDSETRSIRSKIGGSLNVDVPLFNRLVSGANLKASLVRQITLEIKDPIIYTYTKQNLDEIAFSLNRGCRKLLNDQFVAAEKRKLPEANAYFVLKVFGASIDYKVEFIPEARLEVSVAQQRLAKVGGIIEPGSGSTVIRGEALYYGVGLVPVEKPLGPKIGSDLLASSERNQ
jgi:hypothetical protein